MTATNAERRIHVRCLASYNNGVYHDRWIDADQDADDIRAEIAELLRTSPYPNVMVECPTCEGTGDGAEEFDGETGDMVASKCPTCKGKREVPSAEEWAIHDYEWFEGIKLSEYESIDTIADLAEAIEEHGEAFAVWYGNQSRDSVDLDEFRDSYLGEFSSAEDWAADYLDDTGFFDEIPKGIRETIKMYFDFESYARDARLNGDVWFHEAGMNKTFVFQNR